MKPGTRIDKSLVPNLVPNLVREFPLRNEPSLPLSVPNLVHLCAWIHSRRGFGTPFIRTEGSPKWSSGMTTFGGMVSFGTAILTWVFHLRAALAQGSEFWEAFGVTSSLNTGK